MIIVTFNIRGVGGGTKSRYLRHIISYEGAEFVCLQETKVKSISDARCYSLWGDNKVGWLHYEGENGGGGMLSMWHQEAFIYETHRMGKGYIAVYGRLVKDNLRCVVVNVYAACNSRDKKTLWMELSNIKSSSQEVFGCLCGDFNAIRSRDERRGSTNRVDYTSEIRGFNSFIDDNLLLDTPIVGKKYTWFNSNGLAKSRIDRVLVTEEWMEKWPMGKQYVQRREVSDHCAIVMKSMVKDWEPKPFRTIDAWLSEKGFGEMGETKWNSYLSRGSGFIKIKEKLKCLKRDLKLWNKEVFGNINTIKKRILQEIENIDYQDCSGIMTENARLKRCELLSVSRKLIESLTRLRARKRKQVGSRMGTLAQSSTIRPLDGGV